MQVLHSIDISVVSKDDLLSPLRCWIYDNAELYRRTSIGLHAGERTYIEADRILSIVHTFCRKRKQRVAIV